MNLRRKKLRGMNGSIPGYKFLQDIWRTYVIYTHNYCKHQKNRGWSDRLVRPSLQLPVQEKIPQDLTGAFSFIFNTFPLKHEETLERFPSIEYGCSKAAAHILYSHSSTGKLETACQSKALTSTVTDQSSDGKASLGMYMCSSEKS